MIKNSIISHPRNIYETGEANTPAIIVFYNFDKFVCMLKKKCYDYKCLYSVDEPLRYSIQAPPPAYL